MEPTTAQPDTDVRAPDAPEPVLSEGATTTAAESEGVVELQDNEPDTLQRFDFRQQPSLGEMERRKLEGEHRQFLHGLSTRITMYLHSDCDFELEALRILSFRQLVEELPATTHVTLFKVETRPGICLWEVGPALAFALTDRLMGGPGVAPEELRLLSEIEIALLDHLGDTVLEQWCQTWTEFVDWKTSVLGHESESRYLRTSAPETAFLQVRIQVRLGEVQSSMQLAFPVSTLDPLVQRLRQTLKGPVEAAPAQAAPPAPPWNPALDEVTVPLAAELPSFQMPARKVTALKVGDEIPLPASFANQVRLQMGGLERFAGRLGVRDNRWAVQLNQIFKR